MVRPVWKGVRAAIPAQREEGNAVCLDRARTELYRITDTGFLTSPQSISMPLNSRSR